MSVFNPDQFFKRRTILCSEKFGTGATYIDGKMLSVTKYSFQIYFRFHTCNDASAIANRWNG